MAFNKIGGRFQNFSKIRLAVFALIFAGIGGYFIVQSFAATTLGTGSVTFHITDSMTGAPIAGVDLRIRATNDAQYCTTPYATSNSNGDIAFTNCSLHLAGPSDHYYVYYSSAPGYTYSTRPAGNYNNYDTLVTGNNGTKYVQFYNYPSATISASPTSVPYNGSSSITFRGYYADVCHFTSGAGAPASINPGATFATPALTSSQTYTVYCSNSGQGWGSASASAVVTVGSAPVPMSIASFTSNSPVAYAGKITLNWATTGVSYCMLTGPGIVNSAQIQFAASGSWTSPALTASGRYTLGCYAADGGVGPVKALDITVNPQTSTGGGGGSSGGGGGGSSGGGGGGGPTSAVKSAGTGSRTAARAPSATPAPANSSDKEKPTVPTNLAANQLGSGEVDLSWDESTDNVGIDGYIVERSEDGTNWDVLNDSVTETTYTDISANYSTKYTYRVSARDAAGNLSDYALVDITTTEFIANAFANQDSTITSDDGKVSVFIPEGALEDDAICSVVENDTSLPKNSKSLAGPYQLICKTQDGSTVSDFKKPITIKITLASKDAKKGGAFYVYTGATWQNAKLKYSKQSPNFTYQTNKNDPFLVVSVKSGSSIFVTLAIILLIIIIFAGALYFFVMYVRNS